jgi:hypothetical protein
MSQRRYAPAAFDWSVIKPFATRFEKRSENHLANSPPAK